MQRSPSRFLRHSFRGSLGIATVCGLLAAGVAFTAVAAEPAGSAVGPDPKLYETVVGRGVDFLVRSQAADGSFSSQTGIGVTTLAVTALIRSGRTPSDPVVAKSLAYITGFVQPDGGIYQPGTFYRNYEACLAIQCLILANSDGRYGKLIADAERFVKTGQWDETEDKDQTDHFYGGAGYGRSKRPDLSNTSFLLDALKACGRGPDDEAVRKALVFVSRCQNLETEHNTTPFPAKNPDGGFYYTAAAGGQSMAGSLPNGGLRSYASMTYAGLKSMIYAGVKPDDPRVKAARTWIAKYYDLTSNPGLGQQGLYYYYHVFGKTMDAVGEDRFVDARGKAHDWRRDLVEELAKRQQTDGSWINPNDRWMEGDPNLVTGYALLALAYARPKAVDAVKP